MSSSDQCEIIDDQGHQTSAAAAAATGDSKRIIRLFGIDIECLQPDESNQTTRTNVSCPSSNVQKRPRSSDMSEGKWSSLPYFLLWMIKDKLDIFDDIRLTAVCRGWWVASAGYPKKQSVGDGMPWIMQLNTDSGSSKREFISVERNKKFITDMPEFRYSRLMFSKQGWILLGQGEFSVVLVNPFTKGTIKMPDLGEVSQYKCAGSFSTTDEGYPHCVVILEIGVRRNDLTIRTACPEDRLWTIHSSYSTVRNKFYSHNSLLNVGQNVYCFDFMGKIIIYNIATQVWKQIVPCVLGTINHILEFEGHIIKICRVGIHAPLHCPSSYKVLRYNDTDGKWEGLEINGDVLKDVSWFLMEHRTCFALRKQQQHGSKTYVIDTRILQTNLTVYWTLTATNLHRLAVSDLVEENIIKFGPLHNSTEWVAIG